MNTHFVCRGLCGSESSTPGVCPTGDCLKSGRPLIECKCDNGLHQEIGGGSVESEESLEAQLEAKPQVEEQVQAEEQNSEQVDTDGPLNFEN
jgi:hypothetical protein